MEMADGGRTLLYLPVGKRVSRIAGAAEANERMVVSAKVVNCIVAVDVQLVLWMLVSVVRVLYVYQ